jgi:hypothetical protein
MSVQKQRCRLKVGTDYCLFGFESHTTPPTGGCARDVCARKIYIEIVELMSKTVFWFEARVQASEEES